jgi:hypothetical protein
MPSTAKERAERLFRAINMMWKDTGINAVVAVTSVIWIMAVAWLVGDALWQSLAAI